MVGDEVRATRVVGWTGRDPGYHVGSACPATDEQVRIAHGIVGERRGILVDVLVDREPLHGLDELGRHTDGVRGDGVSVVAPDSSWHRRVDQFEHLGLSPRRLLGLDQEGRIGRHDSPF